MNCEKEDLVLLVIIMLDALYFLVMLKYTGEMILKKSLFILIDSLLMSFATFEMLTQVIVLMKS